MRDSDSGWVEGVLNLALRPDMGRSSAMPAPSEQPGEACGLTGRGMQDFEILVAPGTDPASDARLIKLVIQSDHNNMTNDYVGLSEVRFHEAGCMVLP